MQKFLKTDALHLLSEIYVGGVCSFRSCRSERLPVRLCEHSACIVKDVLYVAGGQQRYNMDGRYTTRNLYAFDLRLCVWSTVSIYGFIAAMWCH